MKKLILMCLFVLISSVSLLGQTPVNTEKFNQVKTVKSALAEETKIEIRKPDNSSIMPRQDTDLEIDMKLSVIDKFKKSNKLLY